MIGAMPVQLLLWPAWQIVASKMSIVDCVFIDESGINPPDAHKPEG